MLDKVTLTDKLLANIERFKFPLALCLVGLVLIIGGVFASSLNKPATEYPKASLVDSQRMISVDVSGAVKKPGVYQVKDGSRIEEAIKAAEGFANNANQEYISKYLNLAQKLSDGTKIFVPAEGESGVAAQAGGVGGVNVQSKVNINTASQSELEALPGIGPVTASKIISSRPYQQVADLFNKKAVSKSVFEKLKDLVVVY